LLRPTQTASGLGAFFGCALAAVGTFEGDGACEALVDGELEAVDALIGEADEPADAEALPAVLVELPPGGEAVEEPPAGEAVLAPFVAPGLGGGGLAFFLATNFESDGNAIGEEYRTPPTATRTPRSGKPGFPAASSVEHAKSPVGQGAPEPQDA
jgi:hypothetical protein